MANNGVGVLPRQGVGTLDDAPAGYLEIIANNATGKLATVDESGTVVNYGVSPFESIFSLVTGRNATVTNSYLRAGGNVPMNQAGFVLPYDATIVAISLATNVAGSWTAEVRKNGAATVIASLATTVAKDKSTGLSVEVDADDEIQIFCNGAGIEKPVVTVWFKRR